MALVQFSGIQRTEFHFNTFHARRNIMQAVDTLRHVSGITQTGAAFQYAIQELSESKVRHFDQQARKTYRKLSVA